MKNQTEHIMTKINKPIAAALFAVTMTFVAPAAAQPTDLREEAKVAYAQGRKDYDLGNFEKAIEHFKKAYEKYPDGAFLFNIAQSYRLARNCKQALHFYKRFRSLKESDPDGPLTPKKREEVDRFIDQRTEIRKELRAVQRGLDTDIERLGTVLKVINIALVPVLLAAFVLVAVWRRNRRSAA